MEMAVFILPPFAALYLLIFRRTLTNVAAALLIVAWAVVVVTFALTWREIDDEGVSHGRSQDSAPALVH